MNPTYVGDWTWNRLRWQVDFASQLEAAAAAGLRVTYRPGIARRHTAVLVPR